MTEYNPLNKYMTGIEVYFSNARHFSDVFQTYRVLVRAFIISVCFLTNEIVSKIVVNPINLKTIFIQL